ncbi:hypothetical protein, partial [Bacteroides uniformis]|uniref:hypothetical protein n=1 Tax=Bacteroides uniformis TaxID=820 RepID=UPI001AA152E7
VCSSDLWASVEVYEADLAKVPPDRALTPYTLTALGTCKEKQRKRRPALIPLIRIYAGTQQNTDITIDTEMQQK